MIDLHVALIALAPCIYMLIGHVIAGLWEWLDPAPTPMPEYIVHAFWFFWPYCLYLLAKEIIHAHRNR